MRVIPNFVDTVRITPGRRENAYRAEYGLQGKKVVMYAGNVGLSQSLDLVLARRGVDDRRRRGLRDQRAGAALADLQAQAASLPNVRFVDLQPRERLAEVLAAADVHVVPLKRGLARSSVPSKIYSILASGRPVVASVDAGTEVARTVEAAGAGYRRAPRGPRGLHRRPSGRCSPTRTPPAPWGSGAGGSSRSGPRPAAVARRYADLFAELIGARSG